MKTNDPTARVWMPDGFRARVRTDMSNLRAWCAEHGASTDCAIQAYLSALPETWVQQLERDGALKESED